MKAVRFDRYGGIDVLDVREVPRPQPGTSEVLVEVKAAGVNPGEAMIRQGVMDEIFPATFPSGQGSDLAGVVAEVGAGVDAFSVGDEVLGFTDDRASHAEFVVVPADQLTPKPPAVSWEAAGGLFVAGTTAYAAVRSIELTPGDTVAIAGAAGGVGTIAVQLAKRTGATELGIAPQRIDTVIDFPALERFGVMFVGNQDAADAAVLAELAALIAAGQLEVPIAEVIPLDEVQRAYRTLEQRHT